MASIAVYPNPGNVGTTVTVEGTGFGKKEALPITFNGVRVASAKGHPAKGTFSITFVIPTIAAGTYKVQAGSATGYASATTNLTVSAVVTPPPPPPPPPASTMPNMSLPGWALIFNDDFLTPVAEGAFPTAVSAKWGAYPQGWTDTASRIGRAEWGTYSPEIVSIHDSQMDIRVHTVGAVHKIACPYPLINHIPGPFSWSTGNDQLGGRYAIRFKVDSIVGYKAAWLLWPRSENWPQDGEIDFPEGDFNSTISAFMHRQNGVNGADQDGYFSGATYPSWHVAVIEWKPGISCEFFMDGVSIGKSTSRVPNTPMHWVLQTETALDGALPDDAGTSHVLIDWVAVWSYTP